jgi:hypothetical protein
MVDITSSPFDKPVTWAVPLAIAFRMSARCEMDLSPGTAISPLRLAGLEMMRFVVSEDIYGQVRADFDVIHPFLSKC